MFAPRICCFGLALLGAGSLLLAAPPATGPSTAAAPKTAESRIVAVTIYQNSALVTREVDVPGGAGPFDVVVGPLPPSTVQTSLYSEGGDGLRVLTTRYRTRATQENVQEEMRNLEQQIRDLRNEDEAKQKQIQVSEQNLQLLQKLEDFTASGLKQLTDKGVLDADAVTKLSEFIMTTREDRSKEIVERQQELREDQEKAQFLQREISKISAGSDRTIREAVIVVENPNAAAAGKVRLNYLVTSASWRPQYKLRGSAEKADVMLEYLAAIQQQTGEDWKGVELVLSTAQPLLNAAPPELTMLDVTLGGPGGGVPGMAGPGSFGGGFQGELTVRNSASKMRKEAQQQLNNNDFATGNRGFNVAADIEANWEYLYASAEKQDKQAGVAPARNDGQSVTFHLASRLSVPWRDDEQIIEVARVPMKAEYFYKAVPVLTTSVYRLATLVNDSKYVLLPGEATMYVGTDFVGRDMLPLVAVGEQFTAGFGVDPQLQVTRELVDKSKTIQGGNQVLKFNYRIAISSYKSEAVKVQVWDRLPHSETEAVGVTLVSTANELSTDPRYVREDKPKNLLRWDRTVQPGAKDDKAEIITYEFKMEFDRNLALGPTGVPGQPAAPSVRFESKK